MSEQRPGYRLKELAAMLIRYSGLPRLIREYFLRNKVSILVYHDPSPEALERHLAYLSERYRIIPLETLVDAIHRKDWSKIDRKSLIVTIDDGHAGNFALLDVFKRYEITPTLYLCSHIVGTNRHFWQTRAGCSVNTLKRLETGRLLEILSAGCGFTPEREYPERQALTRPEIAAMSGRIDLESHGKHHLNLNACGRETLRDEITGSKAALETMLGTSCRHFAYPFGDHSERVVERVREAGYRSARTVLPGWNGPDADPYRLKITGMVPDHASVNMLAVKLCGIAYCLECFLIRLVSLISALLPPRGSGEKAAKSIQHEC
jgi:peptidoglycan/xylan/chitin deacetylase (PgdA/CDA1 family)